jgi:4-aminobutyrate aminotransferase
MFGHTVNPDEVAAVIVEPVQGEGGYVVPHPGFLKRLREVTRKHGILLIADEVQCGMGRTGKLFASEHFELQPDIVTLAKGIASGMPLAALMAREGVMKWNDGGHGTTFGGNPVSVAAALATLDLLEDSLCDNAAKVGAHFRERLRAALEGIPIVSDVRGLGLMIGVELTSHEAADAVSNRCWHKGLLVLECGKKAIRMSPPLVITEAQADEAVRLFAEACREVAAES